MSTAQAGENKGGKGSIGRLHSTSAPEPPTSIPLQLRNRAWGGLQSSRPRPQPGLPPTAAPQLGPCSSCRVVRVRGGTRG